jgi:hypothetical protein
MKVRTLAAAIAIALAASTASAAQVTYAWYF